MPNSPVASHLTLSKSLSYSNGLQGTHDDLSFSSAISSPTSSPALLSRTHFALVPLASTLFCRHVNQTPPPHNFCLCYFPLPLKLLTWLILSLSLSLSSNAAFSVRPPLSFSYLESQLLIPLTPYPAYFFHNVYNNLLCYI